MDDEPIAVTNAPSASSNRLRHRVAAALDVGRTSTQMLRVGSTTDSSVVGRTPVPRHDGQRPSSSSGPEELEDLDELRRRGRLTAVPAAASAPELRAGEVEG